MSRSQAQRSVGKGAYPADWPAIARAVKGRVGWRCERCGHPHETPAARATCDERCTHPRDGKQRVLTTHHLDMNPANCAPWNLVALCQACHLSIQSRVDWEQSWMFDLPEWMRWRWEMFVRERSIRSDRELADRHGGSYLDNKAFPY